MDIEKFTGAPGVDETAIEDELAEYLGGPVTAGRQPWSITSLGSADWVMRRFGDAQALVQRYDDEIFLWQQARTKAVAVAAWFEARLKEWATAQRTDRAKSFTMAHGTVSTREQPAKCAVDDDAAVIEWARTACPEAVEQVPASERFLISKSTAKPMHVAVALEATEMATGAIQRITLDPPLMDSRAVIAQAQQGMGPGFVVEAVYELRAVDPATGLMVPGMYVRAAQVSATVKPLGI